MADLRSYNQGFDLDTGGGTDHVLGINLRLSASGGSIEAIGQKAMAASIPVVFASDQSALSVDTELPAAAALSDNFANPTAPGVGAFTMLWDGATWDRAPGNTTDGILVNLGANNDVTVTGTVTVDTELAAAAALADATANPTVTSVGTFLQGYNGTTWDRVRTANTGRLQVDVITGGGTDTPTNPVNAYVTSAALAAGASANLSTADLGAKKLSQVEVWASVAYKAAVHTVSNGVVSTDPIAIGGGEAMHGWEWKAPHRDYAAVTSTAGVDGFRVVMTNLDDANAADVYATFHVQD